MITAEPAARTLKQRIKRVLAGSLRITGQNRRARDLHAEKLRIVMYHGVLPKVSGPAAYGDLFVSAEDFERQLRHLKTRYQVLSLDAVLDHWAQKRPLPPNAAVITLDDGYRNIIEAALPVLSRLQLPATVFVPVEFAGSGRYLWFDCLRLLVWAACQKKQVLLVNESCSIDGNASDPEAVFLALNSRVMAMPEAARLAAQQDIERACGEQGLKELFPEFALAGWDEWRGACRSGLLFIGSHALIHEDLTALNVSEQERSLSASKKRIEQELGTPCRSLAYPYGLWNADTLQAAGKAGYVCAVTIKEGFNAAAENPLKLRRIMAGDKGSFSLFSARLSGVWYQLKQVKRFALWALAAAYLAFTALAWLPTVHYYFDAVAIRDTGTLWPSLTWHVSDKRYFLPAAVLGHSEGAVQFLLLNAYYAVAGLWFPLKPAVTQIPNVVLALLCGLSASRLGSRLNSKRFGALWAACFVLMPWVGSAMRLPWVFNLTSCLLQFVCLEFACTLVEPSPDRRAQLGFAAALALFWCAAPDWPAFIVALAGWFWINKRVTAFVNNRYNLLPLAVVAVQALWTVALFAYGHKDPLRSDLYRYSFLIYPFSKLRPAGDWPAAGSLAAFLWQAFGITLVCILAVPVVRLLRPKGNATGRPASALWPKMALLMGAWLAIFLPVLCISANSWSYGYVLGLPVSFAAAAALTALNGRLQAVVLAAMAAVQLLFGSYQAFETHRRFGDDRRVLAAAAFLNEKRPDLLSADKTALLPRNQASNVGQYARGQNRRIILPQDYPAQRRLHAAASSEAVLKQLVEGYESSGGLPVDWLAVTSENVSGESASFFGKLIADPQVNWIAAFSEGGRVFWIGEVRKPHAAGLAAGALSAPSYSVDVWARVYEKKYDRYAFLKKNARFIDHY